MDFIIIALLVVILGLAAFYVYKEKKGGKKCIGCPYSTSCAAGNRKGNHSCGCCGTPETE